MPSWSTDETCKRTRMCTNSRKNNRNRKKQRESESQAAYGRIVASDNARRKINLVEPGDDHTKSAVLNWVEGNS